MKVEAIIEQAESLLGQSVVAEGYLVVLEEGKKEVVFLSSSEEISAKYQQQITINHTVAELRTIIRPLPRLLLMYRGTMTNPPYLYCFPIQLTATLKKIEDTLQLSNITYVELTAPYSGKFDGLALGDNFRYTAQVDYRENPAIVTSQKFLPFASTNEPIDIILPDENRYARRMTGELIQVSGWLESAPSENDIINYLLFMTHSIRASMVSIGNSGQATSIFIPPTERDKLIKAHINRDAEKPLHQTVDIIGTIDYLQDEHTPNIGSKSPKLYFTEIMQIIVRDMGYLT